MIAAWLIGTLILGGLLALAVGARTVSARTIALVTLVIDLALLLGAVARIGAYSYAGLDLELDRPWIAGWGIRFHLAVDGLSALLLLLSVGLGLMALAASWRAITRRTGLYYACLLWTVAGAVGVFSAVDLFLFYFCWELMLVPMFVLIGGFGTRAATHAGLQFFLFTQLSSLLMLLSILALVLAHATHSGVLSFDYDELLGTPLSSRAQLWIMLGFFGAFAVKMPLFPLHGWMPDAYAEAPAGASVLLAGLLSKTGVYGLLRFAVPLFPEASQQFAPVAQLLSLFSIFYGALLAYTQTDLKRLIAYSSLAHMGFMLLGVYVFDPRAVQGVVLVMVCHGLSTGGLFAGVGALQERVGSRDLREIGGLWSAAPRLSAVTLTLALASLGLPGLGNFAGEVLVLLGAFAQHPALGAIAACGAIAAVIYALRMVAHALYGPLRLRARIDDLNQRELAAIGGAIVLLLWLGLHPQPVFDLAAPALRRLWLLGAGVL